MITMKQYLEILLNNTLEYCQCSEHVFANKCLSLEAKKMNKGLTVMCAHVLTF